MVLVDSSVWIELFRNKGDVMVSLALENLIEEMQACFCGIVKLEVFQWRVRKHGLNIPWSDALIAIIANRNGHRIYSRDKHFDALANLGLIQPYTPGHGGSYPEP